MQNININKDLPNDQYHKDEAVGSSTLRRLLLESPYDAIYHYEKMTNAALLGSAYHELVLLPKDRQTITILPEYRRKTKWSEQQYFLFKQSADYDKTITEAAYRRKLKEKFYENHQNDIVIDHEMYEKALKMSGATLKSIRRNGYEDEFMRPNRDNAEWSLFWTDEKTKVPCKIRPDLLAPPFIVDFKSIDDITPQSIKRSVRKYAYDMQAAWYLHGAEMCGFECQFFIFCFQLNKPRYTTVWYILPSEIIKYAAEKNQKALEEFAKCKYNNKWVGYDAEYRIETLDL